MKYSLRLITITIVVFSATILSAQKSVTLEDIWVNGTFKQNSLYGVKSMNDGTHFSTLEKNGDKQEINLYEYKSGNKTTTIVNSDKLVPESEKEAIKIDSYEFSADESSLLINTNTEHIYRHSTRENTYLFNLKTEKLIPVFKGEKIQYASFSPDGQKVGFVRGNNIFYYDIPSGKEIQVTTDGLKNKIINGASDWVYEEELVLVKAYEWSPNSTKIAYYRFDESKVKEFNMAIYDGLYPTDYRFKYPKAGEENSKVSVHLYDLPAKKHTKLALNEVEYIPRIKWTNDPATLAVMTMNRHQSQLTLFFADANSGKLSEVFKDENDWYIELNGNINFMDDNSFIWTSERSGYNQLYMINPSNGEIDQLTNGKSEITDYIGYDEKNKRMYYIQADEGDPLNRYIYAYDFNAGKAIKLSNTKGNHNAKFSKSFNYYIDYCSTAGTPLRITVNDPLSGKEVRVIQENETLKEKVKEFGFSPLTFFTFKNSAGDDLNGWMIKPPDFDPKKKYPVLMFVYGGPGSQTVKNSWGGSNFAWYQMLASKGYIITSVDNRGTGARGLNFRACTYKNLGKLETEDQIDAAKYLGNQSYVDAKRIGIWGWSYGGYMTTLCMTKGADYFKMGIAVAPVSNWRFYDSIYTERYMQTPQENANGYDDNSPINHVDKLKGKFLLVHGTADDNVHFQNTTELITAMVEAGKSFDLAVYPDKNHGIGGGKTRLHLYRKMTAFIESNL